jgi:hypothetical protein
MKAAAKRYRAAVALHPMTEAAGFGTEASAGGSAPTEIKPCEYRIAHTRIAARNSWSRPDALLIQAAPARRSDLGTQTILGPGSDDRAAAEDAWREAELVLKVKEPQQTAFRWTEIASLLEMHDPRLLPVHSETELGEDRHRRWRTDSGSLPRAQARSASSPRLENTESKRSSVSAISASVWAAVVP